MQIAVSIKGKLIWSGAFGLSDVENKFPVNSETSFRIASVSKSLTAAALGILLQDKKIDLDSSVYKYLPSFPKKRWDFTLRQLAGHTSGIRHYNSIEDASSTKHYSSITESLSQFKDDTLLFEPGSQYSYSSYGYVLLSAVFESASAQNFPDFIKSNVFVPLGMTHTSMDYCDKDIPNRSKFYILNENNKRILAPFIDNSNKFAAGGMISTAEDLVKFGNAMLFDIFLKPEIKNILLSRMKTIDGKETRSGIGWEIGKDIDDRPVYYMDGSLPSARSFIIVYPDEQMVVSILLNTGSSIFFNKEEVFMLADLFLNPSGLDPKSNEKNNISGKYIYSTLFDGESITGEINISENNGKLNGTMTIPNSFFSTRIISVPLVKIRGDEIKLLAIPGNWFSLTMKKNDNTINGKWSFGPIKGDLTGKYEK